MKEKVYVMYVCYVCKSAFTDIDIENVNDTPSNKRACFECRDKYYLTRRSRKISDNLRKRKYNANS